MVVTVVTPPVILFTNKNRNNNNNNNNNKDNAKPLSKAKQQRQQRQQQQQQQQQPTSILLLHTPTPILSHNTPICAKKRHSEKLALTQATHGITKLSFLISGQCFFTVLTGLSLETEVMNLKKKY